MKGELMKEVPCCRENSKEVGQEGDSGASGTVAPGDGRAAVNESVQPDSEAGRVGDPWQLVGAEGTRK